MTASIHDMPTFTSATRVSFRQMLKNIWRRIGSLKG